MCEYQINNGKCPPNSIAKGVDFGDIHRIGLEPLTMFERHALSLVRPYLKVVKIETNRGRRVEHTQSALKACCIHFDHNAPSVCCDLLSRKSLTDEIILQFVGSGGDYDDMYKRFFDTNSANIKGRAHVIYSWHKVLCVVNKLYQNEPPAPPFNEFSNNLKQANKDLVKRAFTSKDEMAVLDADIARDDIAQIRATSEPMSQVSVPNADETNDVPVRNTFVMAPEKATADGSFASVKEYLDDVAETLGVPNDEENLPSDEVGSLSDEVGSSSDPMNQEMSEQNVVMDAQPDEDVTMDTIMGDSSNVGNDDVPIAEADRLEQAQSDLSHQVRRSEVPVNEFTDAEYCRVAPHPDIFLFGTSYGETGGPLSEKQRIHVMKQFTNAAATNSHFLFSEFDKLQRHSTIREMNAKVNNNPQEIQHLGIPKLRIPKMEIPKLRIPKQLMS